MKQKKSWQMVLLGVIGVGLLWLLNSTGQNGTTAEQQLATVLQQIEGVGQVTVYMYERESTMQLFAPMQAELGVLIVAEGAHSPKIKKTLVETVSRVLHMEAHRIVILPMMKEATD